MGEAAGKLGVHTQSGAEFESRWLPIAQLLTGWCAVDLVEVMEVVIAVLVDQKSGRAKRNIAQLDAKGCPPYRTRLVCKRVGHMQASLPSHASQSSIYLSVSELFTAFHPMNRTRKELGSASMLAYLRLTLRFKSFASDRLSRPLKRHPDHSRSSY